jgi:quinol monooxygenase YgiN
VVDDGREEGETFRLRAERVVIGRTEGDVTIPHDISMSTRHAVLERGSGGIWLLSDTGSAGGTFARVTTARLHDGSCLQLGASRLRFDAADAVGLSSILSKYVVLTRMQPGCRNVDWCVSVTQPGRHLVIQKWDSPAAQRAHFDSAVMVEMAQSCAGLLTAAPDIDLWDGQSAHDLA